MKYTAIFLTIIASSFAYAEGDRDEKIRRQLESQGFLQAIKKRQVVRNQGKEQDRKMLNQFMSQLNSTPELNEHFKEELNKFLRQKRPGKSEREGQ